MASLIQRKDGGCWYALFSRPGKKSKVWKSTGTHSKKTAKEIVRQWEIEIAQGNAGIFSIRPENFSNFCIRYLEWAAASKRPGTVLRERGIIENHFKPFFGSWNLGRVDTGDIDRYIAHRKESGCTARNINLELTLLTLMLKKAVEWKKLLRLPFVKIPRLKQTDSRQMRALDRDEVSRLLNSVSGHYHTYIAMLAYTGARKSEVMFLSWDDIDLTRSEISIRPKLEYGFNTKSGKSRVIPMHPDLKTILEKIPEKFGWLFKDVRRGRIKALRRGFDRACQSLGLEDISPHCLRHSFASLMIENGVDVKTVSEILGHASPVITLQVYAHSFASHRKQAITRLPSFGVEACQVIPFPVKEGRL